MTAIFPDGIKTWTPLIPQDPLHPAQVSDVNTVYEEVTAMESALSINLMRGGFSNTETLATTKTLVDADLPLQFLDPGGAGRDVNLPAEADTNHQFAIINTADAAETLTVKNDAGATIGSIAQGENKVFVSNGVAWKMLTAGSTPADASDSVKGIVELATDAETGAGTDTVRAVTPAGLQSKVASDTARGLVELATSAETTAGTDAARAVTPDGLAGSDFGKKMICFDLNGSTALTTSDKGYFRVPDWMNGWKLVKPTAGCVGASSSGVPTFTLKNGATSMLTTNITIDAGETNSKDAAVQPAIDTSHDTVAEGDLLEAATSVSGTGVTYASVYATFQKP